MTICFGYEEDLTQMYAFYCARYENIEWEDFLKMGYETFRKKLNSIPESEPLYTIIKSRTINTAKIKDKDERKYWEELKQINAIPDIYKNYDEIYRDLKNANRNIGGINEK